MNNLDCRMRAVFVLLLALPACAQFVHGQAAPVQPYTAEFKIATAQTLANGTTITRESKEVMARDSQGRTMNANTRILTMQDQPPLTSVHVNDVVEHLQINWNSRDKRARIIKIPAHQQGTCWSTVSSDFTMTMGPIASPPPNPGASAPVAPAPPAPGGGGIGSGGVAGAVFSGPAPTSNPALTRPVREELGTDTIMGVEVHGYRTTRTTPAGRIGNDKPLVHTDESWVAPSLGLTLRQISDDPQMGKTTRELVNLDLSEPDPSVFQPPADYEVVTDEMHAVPCGQRP